LKLYYVLIEVKKRVEAGVESILILKQKKQT